MSEKDVEEKMCISHIPQYPKQFVFSPYLWILSLALFLNKWFSNIGKLLSHVWIMICLIDFEMLHFRETYWIIEYIPGRAELCRCLIICLFRVFLKFLKLVEIFRSLAVFKGLELLFWSQGPFLFFFHVCFHVLWFQQLSCCKHHSFVYIQHFSIAFVFQD